MRPKNKQPYAGTARTLALLFAASFAASAASGQEKTVTSAPKEIPKEEETIELSPFEVSTARDLGYMAANSMSGTRLSARVEDLASSISIVTKQQLVDTASSNINDIFLYESNTEGTQQFTDFEVVNSGAAGDIVVDKTGTNPNAANRIRGMGQANVSLGGFEVSGLIPIDTYNVDSVEITRGPNSSLFGLGNTAGSVNLISGQANLSAARARAMFQVDSYGGNREEGSYNVPIKPNVLAVAVYAMHEEKGFQRDPSYDRTKRATVAVTFRPFRRTTIRASYEKYSNSQSLPNSMTPKDLVSQWLAAGRPSWNPVTGTLTRGDGSKVTANWGSRASLFTPGSGVNLYSDSFVTRMNQFIDNGQLAYFTPGFRPADLASGATTVPGPITPSIANGQYNYFLASGYVYPFEQQVLWKPVGVTDRSLYDYESVNFAAPNYASSDGNTKTLTVEQLVFQTDEHSLSLQGAFFGQKYNGWSHNFVGESGGIASTLMVDINETMLDGTPNPFYMRPFMAGSEPQIRNQIDQAETWRIQGAYRWDLSQRSNWLRWIGVQNLVAYGETRERTSGTPAYRDYILPGHDWYTTLNPDGTTRAKVGNSYRMTYRYYMGDTNGYNVDNPPTRLEQSQGTFPLRWYNAATKKWVNEDVTIEELFDANRLKRENRYTMGFIWQANMVNDIIVPTYGFRRDRLTEFEGPSRTWYDNGYPNTEPMWDFNNPDYAYTKNYGRGDTKTKGLVIKPFSWLHFHYNESDSFRPAGLGYDIERNVLPNPQGEGKDYGFSLHFLKGRLSVKYNQYETFEENARTGGSSSTMTSRLQRIDFDITRSDGRLPDSTDRWHLEASAYRWVLAKHRIADPTVLTTDQVEAFRKEAWDSYIAPTGLGYDYRQWFMDGPTRSFADVNSASARGREIEINYNPDNYLSLKASVTQQKAYDSGVSVANTEWMNERIGGWQKVMIPSDLVRFDAASNTWVPYTEIAGKPWWTTWDSNAVTTTNLTPERWFQENVEATMALINARSGQKKPQTREWSFSLVSRYRLAGLGFTNFIKNINVGGSLRWRDKGAIGYLYNPEVVNRSGQYYMFDATKPVYDGSQHEVDVMVSYDWKISKKVDCLLQLNVRNVFENGGLRVVGVNPDGTGRDFRIIDPRRFVLSATFSL